MGIEPPALSSASVLESVIDYCMEGYEPQVTIARSNCSHAGSMSSSWHHQEYDDALHRTALDSPEALATARRHVEASIRLCQGTKEHRPAYLISQRPEPPTHTEVARRAASSIETSRVW
jgi:hypothetical protein